jgi:uncharacterized protein YjbI with pentapeptide repeats/uncharacterized protein YwqG
LRSANLRGADLRRAKLATSSFIGSYQGQQWHYDDEFTDLRRACLVGARLDEAILTADLSGADLSGAILDGASLATSQLLWACLEGASLRNVDLTLSQLWSSRCMGVDLCGALLRRTNFSMSDISQANLEGATLIDVDLYESKLTGANLRGATCININFEVAADLSEACLEGIVTEDERMQPILKRMEGLARKVWKPILRDGDSSSTDSKYGGRPWLSEDEDWPICDGCGQPMPFILQLNMDNLPTEVQTSSNKELLQIFCCAPTLNDDDTNDDENYWERHAYFVDPYSPDKLVRIVRPDGKENDCQLPQFKEERSSVKTIIGWEVLPEDYPIEQELLEMGIEMSEEESLILDENGMPRYRDKLAGWPRWIQRCEYPNCPKCNQLMKKLVYQFHREELDGCDGLVYVFQCETHPETLTFINQ